MFAGMLWYENKFPSFFSSNDSAKWNSEVLDKLKTSRGTATTTAAAATTK
jgi:hypothetical protein